ncbi:hypothetical protein ACIA5C_05960 [Actinoplanes sp. NPDC051343]|uniref:hypothetical protein n=1 Tax=Actinoplanes sp. NPDC051343 TaxID=3363906 RepID=UPI0037A73C83
MLTLAFTVHVTPPAPALPAAPAAAVATSPAAPAHTAAQPAAQPAAQSAPVLPALPPVETPLLISAAATLLLIAGFALRVRAERAPPLA